MSWLFASFEKSTFKAACKLSIKRMEIRKSKLIASVRSVKKEIVALLEGADESPSKVDLALIKVEGVVRKDSEIQAIEVLQIMCELLHERTAVVASSKRDEPPPDLLVAMHTLIWSAPRLGLDDLGTVKKQLSLKFGADFVALAAKNRSSESRVERKIVQRLTPPVPTLEHKVLYLRSIAEESGKAIDVTRLVGMSSAAGALPDTAELEAMRPGGDEGDGGGGGGGGGGGATAAASASASYPPAGFPAPPSSGGPASYPPAAPAPYPGASSSYPPAATPYPAAAAAAAAVPAYPAPAPYPGPGPAAPPPYGAAPTHPGPAPAPAPGFPPPSGLTLTADDLEARFAKLRGPGP